MKTSLPGARCSAFTLIELLVILAIIALLAGLLLPALARAKQSARAMQCLNQMRQIALATRLYAEDNEDRFPRSQHSAVANRQLPWERAIAPFLSVPNLTNAWTNLLHATYHCPADAAPGHLSYGFNYYFEVGENDDYPGKPQTWTRVADVPRPASTVLFAEVSGAADHVMPGLSWERLADAEAEIASKQHRDKSNYAFVDGHLELLALRRTYNPPATDLWNPQ